MVGTRRQDLAGGSRSPGVCPGMVHSVPSFLSLTVCFLAASEGSSSAPLNTPVEILLCHNDTEAKKPVKHRLRQRPEQTFLLNCFSVICNGVGVSLHLEWVEALTHSLGKENTQKKIMKILLDSGWGCDSVVESVRACSWPQLEGPAP